MLVLLCVLALASFALVQGDVASCPTYCTLMVTAPENGTAACGNIYPAMGTFDSLFVCNALCTLWPTGGDADLVVEGDTVACRQHFAQLAAEEANPLLRTAYCAYASPLGGAEQIGYKCGNLYNFYCDVVTCNMNTGFMLHEAYPCTGSGYESNAECFADASATLATSGVPLNLTAPSVTGDDVECRASAAAASLSGTPKCLQAYWTGYDSKATENCVNSTVTEGQSCHAFCLAYQRVCQFSEDDMAFDENGYVNFDDCMTECGGYGASTKFRGGDNLFNGTVVEVDTVGCRRYQIVQAANSVNDTDKVNFCRAAGGKSNFCKSAAFGIAPLFGLVVALIALVL